MPSFKIPQSKSEDFCKQKSLLFYEVNCIFLLNFRFKRKSFFFFFQSLVLLRRKRRKIFIVKRYDRGVPSRQGGRRLASASQRRRGLIVDIDRALDAIQAGRVPLEQGARRQASGEGPGLAPPRLFCPPGRGRTRRRDRRPAPVQSELRPRWRLNSLLHRMLTKQRMSRRSPTHLRCFV